jgi:RHS repeat-associated protein
VYDDSGRRISKTSNGGAQHYLYDGQNIAAIWSGELTGRPNFAYVHAGTDEPLMRLSDDVAGPGGSSGVPGAYTCHYMQDGIGSVRAFGCIDTASGVMNTTFVQSFDTWGTKVSAGQGVADVSPDAYSFTGRELDASGLNYHRLRYYHPVYGRFTSRDPIGLAGGINPYAYAGNDPVSFADPSGLLAARVGNAANDYAGQLADYTDIGISGLVNQVGQAGEAAVRSAVDIGERAAFSVNGRNRIADGLNLVLGTITEVKNVAYQHVSTQIRDYVDYAQAARLQFDLYVRQNTVLSPQLQDLWRRGLVNIGFIKDPGKK